MKTPTELAADWFLNQPAAPNFMEAFKAGYAQGIADERESCAQLCDGEASVEGIAQRCAALIRASGD